MPFGSSLNPVLCLKWWKKQTKNSTFLYQRWGHTNLLKTNDFEVCFSLNSGTWGKPKDKFEPLEMETSGQSFKGQQFTFADSTSSLLSPPQFAVWFLRPQHQRSCFYQGCKMTSKCQIKSCPFYKPWVKCHHLCEVIFWGTTQRMLGLIKPCRAIIVCRLTEQKLLGGRQPLWPLNTPCLTYGQYLE